MDRNELVQKFGLGTLLTVILFCPVIPANHVPVFESYPVLNIYKGKLATPQFRTAIKAWPDADPRFREAVEFDCKRGSNFGGHYTLARWTCGTGCSNSVVVDAKTGKIYRDTSLFEFLIGPFPKGDRTITYSGLSFRLNSRLLIAEGCFGEGPQARCSRDYYKWIGYRFKLLQRLPVPQTD